MMVFNRNFATPPVYNKFSAASNTPAAGAAMNRQGEETLYDADHYLAPIPGGAQGGVYESPQTPGRYETVPPLREPAYDIPAIGAHPPKNEDATAFYGPSLARAASIKSEDVHGFDDDYLQVDPTE
jgi:hypothetical protein